jgi:hypothetical protein
MGLKCQKWFRWLFWKVFITKSSYFTYWLIITRRWPLLILWLLGQMSHGPQMSEMIPLIILKSIYHKVFIFHILWGVRGRVVKVVDFKSLAPHCCGFESRQGLWILSGEEAIQLAYGTSVVLLMCPFVLEICTEGHLRSSSTSQAGTSRYDLYCVGVTLNQKTNKQNFTYWLIITSRWNLLILRSLVQRWRSKGL